MSVEREAVMRMRVIGDPRNASAFEGVATGAKKAASSEDALSASIRRATDSTWDQVRSDREMAKNKAYLVSQIEREKAALEKQKALNRERKAAGLDGGQGGLMGDIAIARQFAMFRMGTMAMSAALQGIAVAMDKSLTPAERFEKTLAKLPFGLGQLAESASALLGKSPAERTQGLVERAASEHQFRQQQAGIKQGTQDKFFSLWDEQFRLQADARAAVSVAGMRNDRAFKSTYGQVGMEALGEQRLDIARKKGGLDFELEERKRQEAELREGMSAADERVRIAERAHKSTMENFGRDPAAKDFVARSAANMAGVLADHERARSQLEENISKQRELQVGLAGKELELLKHQRDVRKAQLDIELGRHNKDLDRAEGIRGQQADFAMMDRGEQEMALAAARRLKEHGLQSLGDEERAALSRFGGQDILRSRALGDKDAGARFKELRSQLGLRDPNADEAFLGAMGAERRKAEIDATIQLDAAAVATKLAELMGLKLDAVKVLIDRELDNKLKIHEQGARLTRVQGAQ